MARDLDRIIRRALEEAAARCESVAVDEAWPSVSQRLRSETRRRRRRYIGWGTGVAAAVLLLAAFVAPLTVQGWDPWRTIMRVFVGPGETGLVQFGAGPRDVVAQKESPAGAGGSAERAGSPPANPSPYQETSPEKLQYASPHIAEPGHHRPGVASESEKSVKTVGDEFSPDVERARGGAGTPKEAGTGAGTADTATRAGEPRISIASVPDEAARDSGKQEPGAKALEVREIQVPPPEEVTIEAAARKAPFQPLFPAWLPSNTVVLRVTYQPLGNSAEIQIHFGGPEGKDLWFTQRGPVEQYGSGTGFDRTKTKVREVEIDGSKALVLDFLQDNSSLVEWFNGGVCYRMRSDWDGDVTLRIAGSLKPVQK